MSSRSFIPGLKEREFISYNLLWTPGIQWENGWELNKEGYHPVDRIDVPVTDG